MIHRSPTELREQRARLLVEAGLTYHLLRARAATWTLSPEQQDIWHTLQGVACLLAGTTPAGQEQQTAQTCT